jgi:hypothetical protein
MKHGLIQSVFHPWLTTRSASGVTPDIVAMAAGPGAAGEDSAPYFAKEA